MVSCHRGMATDTIHLSISNWMGEREGIDRMVGGRENEERRQEQIQGIKLQSYNKFLTILFRNTIELLHVTSSPSRI